MGVDLYSVPVLLDSEPIQMIGRDPVVWEAASGCLRARYGEPAMARRCYRDVAAYDHDLIVMLE